jgi:hypothetical protein
VVINAKTHKELDCTYSCAGLGRLEDGAGCPWRWHTAAGSPDLAENGRPGSVSNAGCTGGTRALRGTYLGARDGEMGTTTRSSCGACSMVEGGGAAARRCPELRQRQRLLGLGFREARGGGYGFDGIKGTGAAP